MLDQGEKKMSDAAAQLDKTHDYQKRCGLLDHLLNHSAMNPRRKSRADTRES